MLHLRSPQPDVPDARHDPAEQQGAERLLHRRVLGELQTLIDVEAHPLPYLLRPEPVPHQVAAFNHELLAIGPLRLRELPVVVAQGKTAERHVPGLVLHHVGEQLLDQRVLGQVPVHAERGQG